MSAAEAYHLPTEQEEIEALRAAIVRPMGQAQIDAEASELLRRMAETQRDIDRYDDAKAIEIERIERRYATLTDRLRAWLRTLQDAVEALAQRSDFGQAKSRRVGNGVYGVRKSRDRIIWPEDEEQLVAWAREHAPQAVMTKTSVSRAILGMQIQAGGPKPPGTEQIVGTDVPFASPDVNT